MLRDARVHERDGDSTSGRAGPRPIRVDDLGGGTRLGSAPLVVVLPAGGLHDGVGGEIGHTRVGLKRAEGISGKPRGDEVEIVECRDIGRSGGRRLRGDRAGGAMGDLNDRVVAGGEVRIGWCGGPVGPRKGHRDENERTEGRHKAPRGITHLPRHFPRYSQSEYYLPTQVRSSPVWVMFTKAGDRAMVCTACIRGSTRRRHPGLPFSVIWLKSRPPHASRPSAGGLAGPTDALVELSCRGLGFGSEVAVETRLERLVVTDGQ